MALFVPDRSGRYGKQDKDQNERSCQNDEQYFFSFGTLPAVGRTLLFFGMCQLVAHSGRFLVGLGEIIPAFKLRRIGLSQ
jgi:hypothetical protein